MAVATHEADVAYGKRTGLLVRNPVGVSSVHRPLEDELVGTLLEGVSPLSAQSFDTVGPMARDVAGLVAGMELLEPGFAVRRARRGEDRKASGRGRPGDHVGD